jgi:hypothetical protein
MLCSHIFINFLIDVKIAGSILDGVIVILIDIILQAALRPCV